MASTPDDKPQVPQDAPPPAPVGDAAPAQDLQVPDYATPRLSFLQQPWVQNFLPLATSLVLHIGLIVIGLLFARAVVEYRQVVQDQIIIPEAAIVDNAPVGGIPNPGLGGDPNRAAAQDQFDLQSASEGWADRPSETFSQSLMGGGAGEGNAAIALGPNVGLGRGSGTGSGIGDAVGSGSGEGGGALAPFGLPGGGGGIGPKSPFMGISGNARVVVYICDASGSMSTKFNSLKVELKKAVDVLKPVQGFNVIFFSREAKAEALSNSIVMANPQNKRKAFDYVDRATAAHQSFVIPGLELAFSQNPQLIYLLTDGDFVNETNEAVVKKIAELNRDKRVKINTIALVEQREETETFINTLKRIADENGGVFKRVSPSQLY